MAAAPLISRAAVRTATCMKLSWYAIRRSLRASPPVCIPTSFARRQRMSLANRRGRRKQRLRASRRDNGLGVPARFLAGIDAGADGPGPPATVLRRPAASSPSAAQTDFRLSTDTGLPRSRRATVLTETPDIRASWSWL